MDKYSRQSQKTKLWARRRNVTADLQLEIQLRYLERGCGRKIKEHFRNRFRLHDDLRELKKTSDDHDDFVTNDKSACGVSDKPDAGPVFRAEHEKSATHSPRSYVTPSGLTVNGGNGLASSTSASSRCTPAAASTPCWSASGVSNNSLSVDDRALTSSDNASIAAPVTPSVNPESVCHVLCDDQSDLQTRGESTGVSSRGARSRSAEVSSHASVERCRFSPDIRTQGRSCQHYPCTLPASYHALGFRRDDTRTWSMRPGSKAGHGFATHVSGLEREDTFSDKRVGEFQRSLNTLNSSVHNPSHSSVSHKSRAKTCTAPLDLYAEDYPDTSSWSCKTPPQKPGFRPRPASGPAFKPKPADPLLERVRLGSTRPVQQTRLPPRSSVEGRLRGLRALMIEMRDKHESARPVDWAVNYGKRLPMRMLLNPVVPLTM